MSTYGNGELVMDKKTRCLVENIEEKISKMSFFQILPQTTDNSQIFTCSKKMIFKYLKN